MPELDSDEVEKVRMVLDYLGHELEPSILIGGWATYLRVGGDISYDVDLIVGSPEVRSRVRGAVQGVSESHHLQGKKWRGSVDGVHVDLYLPHESELGGKLRLKVEVLAKFTEAVPDGPWRLLTLEAHTISKFAALLDRPDTEKGFKDAREIARLLELGVDAQGASAILAEATAGGRGDLRGHIARVFDLLGPRAGLNKEQRRRLARIRREWDDAIAGAVAHVGTTRPLQI